MMTSTAITATGTRQTQNLTVPATQNTAPVLEFRCLYTSDLRRKQKRWQDGFLRFHTFNKRIMVYEAPSMNYIGDQHWREDDILQDGDELQLDRPVLVQVGEVIGKTTTDLTGLLEKRRKPQEASPVQTPDLSRPKPINETSPAAPPAAPRLPDGQVPQLRPKTLNALLGTPRGPVGRASVLVKSPHEIRQEIDNHAGDDENRSPKRRRIEAPQERTRKPLPPAAFQSREPTTTKGREHRPVTIKGSATKPQVDEISAVHTSEVILASAGNKKRNSSTIERHDRRESPEPVRRGIGTNKNARIKRMLANQENVPEAYVARVRANPNVKPTKPGTNEASLSAVAERATKTSNHHSPLREPAANPIKIAIDKEVVTSDAGNPRKEKTKLQIVSRKPRKKLMYRDLLPPETVPNKRSSRRELGADRNDQETLSPEHHDCHDEAQTRLADRLNRCSRDAIPENGHNEVGQESEPHSLFLSQDHSPHLPASHHRTKEKTQSPYKLATKLSDASKLLCKPEQAYDINFQRSSIPWATSTVHSTAVNLSKMDQILFPQRSPPRPHKALPSEPHIQEISSRETSPSPTLSDIIAKSPQSPSKSPAPILVPSSPGFQTQPRPLNGEISDIELPKSPESAMQQPHAGTPHSPSSPKPVREDPLMPSQKSKETTSKKPSPKPAKGNEPPTEPTTSSPPIQPTKSPIPIEAPPLLQPLSKAPHPNNPSTFSLNHPSHENPIQNDLNNLTIAQKSLPAFQAQRPKPKPRSPLKKSNSDSSAMGPPSALGGPNERSTDVEGTKVMQESNGGENKRLGKGRGLRDTPEAWDLFGCWRDGVPCSYAEFKVKAGLV